MFDLHKGRNAITIVNDEIKRTKLEITLRKTASYIRLLDLEGENALICSLRVNAEGTTTIEDRDGRTRLKYDSNGAVIFVRPDTRG